ncbi:uncharacterized protein LOC116842027 [Odontomachus brunneus]|uniref:uncharacterized protein LOC116842027 n=1 Tax=Odontomachus brunneus TaxID=486640 RepID=UPI0013F19AA7|nr:uncharacterized protein LOC116842027 [Odontomachus brunneus]
MVNGLVHGWNSLGIIVLTAPNSLIPVIASDANILVVLISIAYVTVPYMSISAIFMSITVVFLVMFCFMPESPYYMAMKGRTDDTEAVLEKLRGKTDVSDEVELVLETVKSNSRRRTRRFRELLTDYLYVDMSAYLMVLFIMTIILICANNCGAVGLYITVQSEIFAIQIKALATCVEGITSAVFNIIACKTYILIAVEWGYGPMPPFLWYFVNVVICTAVILRIMPETKGKTFVQIQKELDD